MRGRHHLYIKMASRDNIQVCLRVRPFNHVEKEQGADQGNTFFVFLFFVFCVFCFLFFVFSAVTGKVTETQKSAIWHAVTFF